LDGEGSFESDGGIVGLYYGRNWQSGSWVYGLEGSASYADGIDFFQDEAGGLPGDNDLLDVDVQFLGTSRIKVGYAFDNILLYAAGGLATGYFQVSMDDIDIAGGPFDDDGFAFGWTIGAGIETKFAENWSARIEYLYVNFDDDFSITDGGTEYETNLDLDTSIVRGGIAYHF
jgi:outer membrane immunogenic protein